MQLQVVTRRGRLSGKAVLTLVLVALFIGVKTGSIAVTIAVTIAILVGMSAVRFEQNRRRRAYLVASFGEQAAANILAGVVWQGATQAMVEEILGPPSDVAEEVYKRNVRHSWKYRPIGRRGYALKVAFENGTCVGWERL